MKKRVALLLLLIALVLLTGLCRAEVQGMTVNGETVPNGGSVAMTEFDTVNIILEDDQEYFYVDYEIYEETPEEKKWLTGGIRMLSNGGTFTMQAPEGYKRVRVDFRVSYMDEGFGRYSDETDYCFFIELSPFERDKNLLSVELSENGYTAWITAAEEADLYLDVVGWCRELFHLTPGEPYQYVNDSNETVKLYAADANDEMSTTVIIPPAKYRINGKAVEPGDTVPLTDLGDFEVDFRVEDHVTNIEYTAYSVATGEPLSSGPLRFKVENNMTNAFTVHSLEPQLRYEFSYVYDDGTVGEPFEIFANVKASGAEQDDGIVTVEMKETEATFVFNREAQLFVTEGTLGRLLWARNGESAVFEAGETYRYSCENFLIPRGQTVTLYAVAKEDGVVYRSPDYVLTGVTTVLAEEEPDETGWMLADAETVMIADAGETAVLPEPEPIQAEIEPVEPEVLVYNGLIYTNYKNGYYDDQDQWVNEDAIMITGGTGMEDVTIPAVIDGRPVRSVCSDAFRGDNAIRTLTFAENDSIHIYSSAFEGCLNLTEVKLNGTAEHCLVGNNAFRGVGAEEIRYSDGTMLAVTEFSRRDGDYGWMPDGKGGAICAGPAVDLGDDAVIPDTLGGLPVTEICESAFSDVKEIKTLTLPKTVTTVGAYAFNWCDNLTEIRGGSLETIGDWAFDTCKELRTVEGINLHAVQAVNFDFYSHEDSIVTDSTGQWRYYTDEWDNVVLTGLADGVKMQKCTIPDTLDGYPVGRIAEHAFEDKKTITSVSFPEGLYGIGNSAFKGTGITNLIFPSSMLRIESLAFNECKKLKSLTFPASVEFWGHGVFYDCESVASVTIEDGVTKLPEDIFYGLKKLTSVEIPASVRSVGNSAFAGTGLKKITVPVTVEEWGRRVFSITKLTSVVIEDGVTTIPEEMFYSNDSLISVTIPASVKTIGNLAFYGCEKLTKITLNEGLETIGESAFACAPLTKIVLPTSVKTVGTKAFRCEKRQSLNVTVNGLDTEFGKGVFGDTEYKDTDIYAESGYEYPKLVQMTLTTYTGSKADLLYRYNVKKKYVSRGPESIVTAPAQAVLTREMFASELQIEELTIPEGVEELADNFMMDMTSLTKVKLPKTLKKIGANAFAGCINLTSVSLPKGLESIGELAFGSCASLKELVIPDTVTDLGKGVFIGCELLAKVTLPQGITEIPAELFGQTGLKKITIPATVETIGENAFAYCRELATVTLPKALKKLDDHCFSNASALAQVTIPDTVETIGAYAFLNCGKLKKITLPKGLTEITDYCFAGTGLTSVKIPASVHTIGKSAFELTDLKNVTLSEGLEMIEERAFYGLFTFGGKPILIGKLTTLTVPSTVARIGANAFAGHTGLKKVTILNPDTEIGEDAFRDAPGYAAQ